MILTNQNMNTEYMNNVGYLVTRSSRVEEVPFKTRVPCTLVFRFSHSFLPHNPQIALAFFPRSLDYVQLCCATSV